MWSNSGPALVEWSTWAFDQGPSKRYCGAWKPRCVLGDGNERVPITKTLAGTGHYSKIFQIHMLFGSVILIEEKNAGSLFRLTLSSPQARHNWIAEVQKTED